MKASGFGQIDRFGPWDRLFSVLCFLSSLFKGFISSHLCVGAIAMLHIAAFNYHHSLGTGQTGFELAVRGINM